MIRTIHIRRTWGGMMRFRYRKSQGETLGYQLHSTLAVRNWNRLLGIEFESNNVEYTFKVSKSEKEGGKRVTLLKGVYDQYRKVYLIKGYPNIFLCRSGVDAILKTKNRKSMTLYFKRVKN